MKDAIAAAFWWPVVIAYTVRDVVQDAWDSLRSTGD